MPNKKSETTEHYCSICPNNRECYFKNYSDLSQVCYKLRKPETFFSNFSLVQNSIMIPENYSCWSERLSEFIERHCPQKETIGAKDIYFEIRNGKKQGVCVKNYEQYQDDLFYDNNISEN